MRYHSVFLKTRAYDKRFYHFANPVRDGKQKYEQPAALHAQSDKTVCKGMHGHRHRSLPNARAELKTYRKQNAIIIKPTGL